MHLAGMVSLRWGFVFVVGDNVKLSELRVTFNCGDFAGVNFPPLQGGLIDEGAVEFEGFGMRILGTAALETAPV
jgi:hypothetical protein